MIAGQMTIYDFLDIQDPQVPPEFDSKLMEGIPALDVFYKKYPETPVYLVTKSMDTKWSPLYLKALICTYTGWWHGIQGWNLDNRSIESWAIIPGATVKNYAKPDHPKLAWTPQEYEKEHPERLTQYQESIFETKEEVIDWEKTCFCSYVTHPGVGVRFSECIIPPEDRRCSECDAHELYYAMVKSLEGNTEPPTITAAHKAARDLLGIATAYDANGKIKRE